MSKSDKEFVYWVFKHCNELRFLVLRYQNSFPNSAIEWQNTGEVETVHIVERTILLAEEQLEKVDKIICKVNDNSKLYGNKKILEIDTEKVQFKNWLKISYKIPNYLYCAYVDS